MTKYFFLFLWVFLLACGSNKSIVSENNENSEPLIHADRIIPSEKFNVQIQIEGFSPYCGGMAPTEEMIARQYYPATGTYLLLNISEETSEKVMTDSQGVLKLKLDNGKYGIKEIYKNVTYEDFLKSYSDSSTNYMLNGDEECYQNWWASNLIEFEIINQDSLLELKTTIHSQCFVGINPCKNYIGPYPP